MSAVPVPNADAMLLRHDDGGVTTLTLNRPHQFNTLSYEMLETLIAAVDAIAADDSVRVVVLAGEGKAFSAGGDIRAWAGMEANEFGHAWVRFGHRVFERLATLRMPLVA